jgi:hypothetical protein
MTTELDKAMAKLASQGVTVSTRLADPTKDTPMRRIRDAAVRAGVEETADSMTGETP